jgi:predicted AlkP superfamily phosphohydrolase/phosphomutase
METGALYDHPSLKGNLDWSLSFKIEDIPNFGTNIKPIWQVLNERGYSVGIMNVPTTFPAPIVDGFFVSGGGGGSNVIQDPIEELCYPKVILNTLKKIGYIVDERFGSLIYEKKYTKAEDIFSRLKEKNQKRTESFIKLSVDYKVDFGFVVYKSSSVIAELLLMPEHNRNLNGDGNVKKELLEEIKKYYQAFDEQIKHLVKTFREAEIMQCVITRLCLIPIGRQPFACQ